MMFEWDGRVPLCLVVDFQSKEPSSCLCPSYVSHLHWCYGEPLVVVSSMVPR